LPFENVDEEEPNLGCLLADMGELTRYDDDDDDENDPS
jgi:hypothetical protein